MPNSRTISAISLNNSKVAQHVTINHIAKYARLVLLCGVSVLAVLLLIADPENSELWLSNFILSKVSAGVLFTAIATVAKHWNSKNLLPNL